MDINEKITVELSWEDVAAISSAVFTYKANYGKTANEEILERMTRIVNKLGYKLYITPLTDEEVQ